MCVVSTVSWVEISFTSSYVCTFPDISCYGEVSATKDHGKKFRQKPATFSGIPVKANVQEPMTIKLKMVKKAESGLSSL